jgi:hypothetical protein
MLKENWTVFPRPMLHPPRVRRTPRPLPTAAGQCRTRVLSCKIKVRGGGRMTPGIRFDSVKIVPPPSLNDSLSHRRPNANLPEKSNSQFTWSRRQSRGRTVQGGFPNRGTTRRQRRLLPTLPYLHRLPPLATSPRSKLYLPPRRTTRHDLGQHPEGTPSLLIPVLHRPLSLRSKSPHRSLPHPLIRRRMG